MIKRNQTHINRLNILSDAVLAFVTMLAAYYIRFYLLPSAIYSLPAEYYIGLAFFSALLHIAVYELVGFYRLTRANAFRNTVARMVLCELICMLLTISGLYIFALVNISRWTIVISFGLQCLLMGLKLAVKRAVLRHYRRRGLNLKHMVLVGSGETARNFAQTLSEHPDYGYHIVGYFAPEADWAEQRYLGDYRALAGVLRAENPDEAVISMPPADYPWIADAIQACEQTGTRLQIIPCYDKYISSQMEARTLEGINLINIRRIPLEQVGAAFFKRLTDILFSLIILIVTSPALLFAAIGVRLSSPGPIIFRQERVGMNKRLFKMYKFRSMRCNDREATGWSGKTDARRTAFGAFLRKCSIDELPQFLNVLKGDMSIVGPRPEVPYYVEQYRDEIPLYMIKHYVKPGITGWAQVNGLRGDTSIRKRIEYDIYYIENWTPAFDFKIMFLTVFKLRNQEQWSSEAKPQ